jgi:hypothetical protein
LYALFYFFVFLVLVLHTGATYGVPMPPRHHPAPTSSALAAVTSSGAVLPSSAPLQNAIVPTVAQSRSVATMDVIMHDESGHKKHSLDKINRKTKPRVK